MSGSIPARLIEAEEMRLRHELLTPERVADVERRARAQIQHNEPSRFREAHETVFALVQDWRSRNRHEEQEASEQVRILRSARQEQDVELAALLGEIDRLIGVLAEAQRRRASRRAEVAR